MKIEKRLYKNIPASSTDQLDYVIPNGNTLYLRELSGDANYSGKTRVEIVFDPLGTPEILFSTNGSNTQRTFVSFLGDGIKIVRIKLINDELFSSTLGGFFWGEQQ